MVQESSARTLDCGNVFLTGFADTVKRLY